MFSPSMICMQPTLYYVSHIENYDPMMLHSRQVNVKHECMKVLALIPSPPARTQVRARSSAKVDIGLAPRLRQS